ncbi:hypothetical protein BH23CHL7_BH23CHL7_19750 [soil metagenome]
MSDSSVTRFLPPREPGGPVSCAVCGCRLMAATGSEDGAYRHFRSLYPQQDARCCRPHCVDALHNTDGRVLAPLGASGGDSTAEAAAA